MRQVLTDVGLPGGLNGRQVADAARALTGEVTYVDGGFNIMA